MKICEHFKPRQKELFVEVRGQEAPGPCRYHLGGATCAHRQVFLCETNGHKHLEGTEDDGYPD